MILRDDFEEIFQCGLEIEPTRPLALKPDARARFTALLTETHSRKFKYMQAIALNMPCLSPKWITRCPQTQAVVDWHPYLLSSGYSNVLGAYISWSMKLYDTKDVKLEQRIGKRLLATVCRDSRAVCDAKIRTPRGPTHAVSAIASHFEGFDRTAAQL